MRKISFFLCNLAVFFSLIGVAGATPVFFDVSGGSVVLSDVSTFPSGWTSLTASLVPGLSNESFTLGDGSTQAIDFFTLTATGFGLGDADINASLYFSDPSGLIGSGSGYAEWATFFGKVSAGVLTWNPATLPDVITLSDGNVVSINFESGAAIVCGNTVTVHAFISNYGNAVAPVPEPATMLLLGTGLLGMIAVGRKRFNEKS